MFGAEKHRSVIIVDESDTTSYRPLFVGSCFHQKLNFQKWYVGGWVITIIAFILLLLNFGISKSMSCKTNS